MGKSWQVYFLWVSSAKLSAIVADHKFWYSILTEMCLEMFFIKIIISAVMSSILLGCYPCFRWLSSAKYSVIVADHKFCHLFLRFHFLCYTEILAFLATRKFVL